MADGWLSARHPSADVPQKTECHKTAAAGAGQGPYFTGSRAARTGAPPLMDRRVTGLRAHRGGAMAAPSPRCSQDGRDGGGLSHRSPPAGRARLCEARGRACSTQRASSRPEQRVLRQWRREAGDQDSGRLPHPQSPSSTGLGPCPASGLLSRRCWRPSGHDALGRAGQGPGDEGAAVEKHRSPTPHPLSPLELEPSTPGRPTSVHLRLSHSSPSRWCQVAPGIQAPGSAHCHAPGEVTGRPGRSHVPGPSHTATGLAGGTQG